MNTALHRAGIALLCAAAALTGCRTRAPDARLWDRWTAHDERNPSQIDNRLWNDFLHAHLRRAGRLYVLAYASVSPDERIRLAAWVRLQQRLPVSQYSLRQQRAFWLNLYDAGTVLAVFDAGLPHDSHRLRKLRAAKRFIVEGQALSLDDIENHILRPRWRDPRTVEVLYRASRGGPELPPQAFDGEHLDEQLDAAARAFVNSGRAAQLQHGRLIVCSLYRWYRTDFGGDGGTADRAIIAHLQQYAVPALAEPLRDSARIAAFAYDWTLSSAP
jgi:hypothetical protein